MHRLYALAVAVAMQIGLLISRAAVGSALSGSDISFGQALVNNAIASLVWSAPLVVPVAIVNYFSVLLLFRAFTRSRRTRSWQRGAAAAFISALIVVLLGRCAEWISLSMANVTHYGDQTPLILAAWISSVAVLVWSTVAGAILIPLATATSR
jgi:hypothetical protein